MAAKKGDRPQTRAKRAAQARRAAELARQKQARQRKMTIGGAVAMVAVVAILGVLLLGGRGGGGKTEVATSSGSAAGKPCVKVADPLPNGAPAVAVKTGPPPKALITEDLKEGTGAEVSAGQTLTVNYIGVSCSTGKIFDSSYSRNEPATFPLNNVIPGWQKGIPGMKVGGQRLLGIPPDQGYGDQGGGGDIAPGETLWFVVEVLDAKAS